MSRMPLTADVQTQEKKQPGFLARLLRYENRLAPGVVGV